MVQITELPSELLSRIIDEVANIEDGSSAYWEDYDLEDAHVSNSHMDLRGLVGRQARLASVPMIGLEHVRNLRLVSRHFSGLCTTSLFRIVKVIGTGEAYMKAIDRYNNILGNEVLRSEVRKVIFQTRKNPYGDNHGEETVDSSEFIAAMANVGKFPNIICAELAFADNCAGIGLDGYMNDFPEDIEFRVPILEAFFAGLNHKDHPAAGVHNLSLKNLQNKTPDDLMTAEENDFKTNFGQVMSRVKQLSLQIATERDEAAAEFDRLFPELHDFFDHELEQYWLETIRENLVYLKIYAWSAYWGYFPRAKLPHFPHLKSLVLGNMTISHDDQIKWITSHAKSLEELVLDDCPVQIGARLDECRLSPDNHVDRSPIVNQIDGIARGHTSREDETWTSEKRCHHIFDRFKQDLPRLKNFAYGHGDWYNDLAYDTADSMTSHVHHERYIYLDEGNVPCWLTTHQADGTIISSGSLGEPDVLMPECAAEDRRALVELLDTVRRRR